MPKTVKSRQSSAQRAPKFLIGAVVGAVIGTLALMADPTLAVNILVGLIIIAAYVFFLIRQRNTSKQWSPQAFSPVPVLGALVIGVMSIAGLQYLGSSLAWHPEGEIKKTVQNVTTNSQVEDANTASSALAASPGDILNYAITIKNVAPPAKKQYNDMAYTVLTDTLPAGVELVSDPTKRTIKEDIGLILPGKSVTMTYQVKVTATTSNALIENKACFKADSVVKDNPQKGCDVAIIKTKKPVTPTTPPTPPNPPTPPTPPTPPNPPTPTPPTTPPPTPPTTPPPANEPPQLPNVGPGNIIIVALFAAVTGYLFSGLYTLMNGSKARQF